MIVFIIGPNGLLILGLFPYLFKRVHVAFRNDLDSNLIKKKNKLLSNQNIESASGHIRDHKFIQKLHYSFPHRKAKHVLYISAHYVDIFVRAGNVLRTFA